MFLLVRGGKPACERLRTACVHSHHPWLTCGEAPGTGATLPLPWGCRPTAQDAVSADMRCEQSMDRTLEACHYPPFAVVTPTRWCPGAWR